jgi:hypothetical protein
MVFAAGVVLGFFATRLLTRPDNVITSSAPIIEDNKARVDSLMLEIENKTELLRAQTVTIDSLNNAKNEKQIIIRRQLVDVPTYSSEQRDSFWADFFGGNAAPRPQ